MSEHLDPDTPSVHQNGDHSVHTRRQAAQRSTPHPTETRGHTGGLERAPIAEPAPPYRFAVYLDSDETEELFDEELLASAAFDPARILAWGLEDAQEACASLRGRDAGHREHFVCSSAEGVRELLELAGSGPLRILYL